MRRFGSKERVEPLEAVPRRVQLGGRPSECVNAIRASNSLGFRSMRTQVLWERESSGSEHQSVGSSVVMLILEC